MAGGRLKQFCFVTLRILKYKLLSTCKRVEKGSIQLYHPLLLSGNGKIIIKDNLQNGVIGSTNYYSHYNFLEARYQESEIIIGKNVVFSNSISIISEAKVIIEDNVIFAYNVLVIDTDGHDLAPDKRITGTPKREEIIIKKNALLYPDVKVLKGVTIGENSIIGAGSIVTKDIPDNVFAAGNPARVIRDL